MAASLVERLISTDPRVALITMGEDPTRRRFETAGTSAPRGDPLELPGADVTLFRHCFGIPDSDRLLGELYRITGWRQETIKRQDATIPLPRLTAWYGDPGRTYTFSSITMEPQPWSEPLLEIKGRIELISPETFNSVLLNLYRDGRDGVGWHSDDEPELGENPVIGSVSLGGTRTFALRHKKRRDLLVEIELTHGSYLLMKGTTQRFYHHQVPRTEEAVEPRINLTFRRIG